MIYAGTKGWTDTVPVPEVRRFETELRRVLPGQPRRGARRHPHHRGPARRGRARQGPEGVPRGLRHGEGRLTHGRRPGTRPAAAHPQRPVDQEDHQGDGAHRRLADRAGPEPDRRQPPLPPGHGPDPASRRPPTTLAAAEAARHARSRPSTWAILAIVGDRGLSGAYNSGVLRATERLVAEHRADGVDRDPVDGGQEGPVLLPLPGQRGRAARSPASPTARASTTPGPWPPPVRPRSSPARSTRSCWSPPASSRPGPSGSRRAQLLPLPLPEDGDRASADAAAPAGPTGYTEFEPDAETLLAELAPRATRGRDLRRPARRRRPRSHGPAAGHGGGHRQRRRADPHPDPGHEPGPPGRHHHRDHGDRGRSRSAPPVEGSLTAMTTTATRTPLRPGHARGRPRRRHRRARRRRRVPARTPCPRSTSPSRWTSSSTGTSRHRHRRGGPADRRGPGALHLHAADRRPGRGARRCATWAGASPCRWATPCSATSSTCWASRSTPTTSRAVDDHWEIHRSAPGLRPARAPVHDVRDRHQGHRPARALRPGRQDRPVRRGRRGQDRHHPGDDQPGGPPARRCVGLRRRGRAHPRGHRPVARDAGVRRHREGRPRLRPDGRASRRPAAGGPGRADHGRVLPGREEPGRAALRRQHLPLRPGRLRGLDPARPHALGRGLPAHPGRRDGRAAGAHHLDPGPVDHLAAGRLRAGRRLHRPGAVHHLHPPRRHHRAVPPDRRPRHLPGRGPAGLDLEHPGPRGRGRAPLRRGPAGPGGAAALQGAAGHHRHPRASTSSPRRTG